MSEPSPQPPGNPSQPPVLRRLLRSFTSVSFAVVQTACLALAVLGAALFGSSPFARLGFGILLTILAGSTLGVVWQRRPYPGSRIGFLLVHGAPALILGGALWTGCHGGRFGLALAGTGCGALLVGSAWMFYLKPPLKRREAARKAPAPAPAATLGPRSGRAQGQAILGLAFAAAALLGGVFFALEGTRQPGLPGPWAIPYRVLASLGYACVTLALAAGGAALLPPEARWRQGFRALDPMKLALQGTRAGFLMWTGALVLGVLGAWGHPDALWLRGAPQRGLLVAWLAYAAVLHTHHLKPVTASRTWFAAALAWGMTLLARVV